MLTSSSSAVLDLPDFKNISMENMETELDSLLNSNLAEIQRLIETESEPGWDNLIAKLDELEDRLRKFWSPINHLNYVCNSETLRESYNKCLPKLSEYYTALGQNQALFTCISRVFDKADEEQLDAAQRKDLENRLLDFHLSGVDLEAEKKQEFGALRKRLSELGSRFGENVLDATMAWTKLVEHPDALKGLPDSALEAARQAASEKGKKGYLFTLDFPSYLPVMTYADDRDLRREMYEAYVSRASDQGPNAGQWDNKALIDEILELRQRSARLLGFENYAELSLEKKMAEDPDQVLHFLRDLCDRSLGMARQEMQALQEFARQEAGLEDMQAWDVSYFSEKLRQHTYRISQEELRAYFPLEKVLSGMFDIVGRLFDLSFKENPKAASWHPDVRCYEISRQGQILAGFYLDLFARENKRGGAWMDACQVRRGLGDGRLQLPVAYLVCNFTAPARELPSLLTHMEVTTLFHEFGHGLHHMLSTVDYPAVSGINGVAWDAVELPSQLLENWCWEAEALPLISAHYESGDSLPNALLEKMLAAKNFQSAMQMVRQLEFALFDFRLHKEYSGHDPDFVQKILDEVRAKTALLSVPPCNRFQNSFSHIFAGGYAAGYYSYKWAEVLSADVFEKFQQQGIMNQRAGEEFLNKVLQWGGARPAMDLFKDYRGREPEVAALLRASGISPKAA